MGMRLRVVSYNIHKGFSRSNLDFVLEGLRESVRATGADLLLLQEVIGHHQRHAVNVENWPSISQFEYLADQVWSHYAYGKNAVYSEGHHGNAILSKYPILQWHNLDVSRTSWERRGSLHVRLDLPELGSSLDVICLHLSLFERDRRSQLLQLARWVEKEIPSGKPLIIGGDFNDWLCRATEEFTAILGLKEAFFHKVGSYASTFPSWLPLLRLDRLYYRGVHTMGVQVLSGGIWGKLSDHLPILSDFSLD